MISDQSSENRTGLAFSRLCGMSGLAPVVDQRSTITAATAISFMAAGAVAAIAMPAIIERATEVLVAVIEWL